MKNRLFAIDAVRGWVMIFMALDHAMYFCYVHISAEGFQGIRPEPMPDIAHYLTRFITHYCAPTFIFLAGLSVSLYTLSRRSHLSEGTITKKLLTRGFFLIALQIIVVNLAWSLDSVPGTGIIYFGIIACIGSGMMILAFIRRLPVSLLFSSSILLLLIVPLLLNVFPLEDSTDQSLLEIMLQPDTQGEVKVLYPILPWLGVMGMGSACGFWIGFEKKKITKFFLSLGLFLLFGWAALRLSGCYGNLTPYQGGDWRDFMLMSKYPPSLVFLMWNLGGMAIVIAGHNYLETKLHSKQFWHVIVLFGQTPLFFYLMHLYVYRALSLIPFLTGSLARGYLAWLVGLMIMIPLCAGYRSLKRRYPNSILQYV